MAEHTFAGLTCSDVLEASGSFVLGAVEPAQAEAIRSHLAACPEAHAEVAELGSVVPALFEALEPLAPPASLRTRILDAAAAEARRPAMERQLAVQPPMAPEPTLKGFARGTRPEPAHAPEQRVGSGRGIFGRPLWGGLAGVAAVLAIALGAWNLQLRADIDGLVEYRNGVVAVIDKAAGGADLAVLSSPTYAGGPTGLAAVAGDGSVALVMRDLSPTTGAQVYEAWLIAGTSAPVPIGHFTVGGSGTATFTTAHPSLGDSVTVALTLEAGPGATTPTQPVIAAGTAATQS